MIIHFSGPFSLRARFLAATAAVILALTLAYGFVAVIGYITSFDKETYRSLRFESNLFYSLAKWQNNQLEITLPQDLELNYPALVLIYDKNQKLIWRQRKIKDLEDQIEKAWLNKPGLYRLYTNKHVSSLILENSPEILEQLKEYDDDDDDAMAHSIAVNRYVATTRLPELTIVVVDSIPQELMRANTVWKLFTYVLLANVLLVVPLLWLAAYWSLHPIQHLARQIRELETGQRELLDESPPRELRGLVRNLNILLNNERQRYIKYNTTLSDLTHSLKTPLAVLQSTLRSVGAKQQSIEDAEPVMLEQISRISQQVGYYLHRATVRSEQNILSRELHSVSALLDSLCSALNKVYQRKGVAIALDIPPELTFIGERNDFMEVLGNLLDNACKYCLEFIEVSARLMGEQLLITIDDDGPGVPESLREKIFLRGQRADTLEPGQGLGLALSSEILEQYQGKIIFSDSPLGGARIQLNFRQDPGLDSDD